MRPDVVWFGEVLNEVILDRAFRLAHSADLCLVVGTSALVHPAASVPLATLGNGGKLVEINLQETSLTPYASAQLNAPAGIVLTKLIPGKGTSPYVSALPLKRADEGLETEGVRRAQKRGFPQQHYPH